jgi:1,4-dihydroxy-2-naphthoate octaprenyltransferase
MDKHNHLLQTSFLLSLIYLPLFLFAISQTHDLNMLHTGLFFIILQALMHPSNQLQIANANMELSDNKTDITQQAKNLITTSISMNSLAVVLSILIFSLEVGVGVLGYLLLSKLHNNNPIRLRKYAIISLLLTMTMQGVLLFALTQYATGKLMLITNVFAIQACAFFVGFIYPLTQMHTQTDDLKRGDLTISIRLGLKGTFVLSLVMFLISISFMGLHFYNTKHVFHFYVFLFFLSPVAAYFFWWRKNTRLQPLVANYRFTRLFVVITTICMSLFSLVLIYLNHFTQ